MYVTEVNVTCNLPSKTKIKDRKMYGRRGIKKLRPCGDGSRDWNDVATDKKCQEPPDAGRGKEVFSPRASIGSTAL